MRIAKPLLLIGTPIGVIGAIREAYRLTGGLVVLLVALLGMIGTAITLPVLEIRREQRQEQVVRAASDPPPN